MSIVRGTGIDSTVKLYLKGNGANGSTNIYDDSQSHKTVTEYGGSQISTAQSKFGGSSLFFDGDGDYLSIPASADWNYTNGFSISFWFRPNRSNVLERVFAHFDDYLSFYKFSNGYIYFMYNEDPYTVVTTYTIYNWHYVVITFDSGTLKVYFDGVLKVTQSSLPAMNLSSYPIIIGQISTSQYYQGYLEDFIIQTGVAIDGTKVPTRQRG